MVYETLILSGCSTKMPAYIGVFETLFEHKIIDMKNIKKIISCSSGSLFMVYLILGYNIEFMKYSLKIEFDKIFDLDDLNDLFNMHWLFNNNVDIIIKHLLYGKYKVYDITLDELYDKTKIECIFKVFNISNQEVEFISYKNNPKISLLLAVQMTTCIPILFKPILYNDLYYIDGGVSGSFPYMECENYLGICISSINKKKSNIDINNVTIIEYLYLLFKIGNNRLENDILFNDNKNIIRININSSALNFDIPLELKKEFIENGKKQCLEHLNKYFINKVDSNVDGESVS